MNIIVCVKEIADPEAPSEDFRLDTDKNVLVASPKVLKVLNPFDEQAVEAALQIKDKVGAKVTALSIGKGLDRVVTKKPVFMGADELILLEDDHLCRRRQLVYGTSPRRRYKKNRRVRFDSLRTAGR